jgi:hypothetical protein
VTVSVVHVRPAEPGGGRPDGDGPGDDAALVAAAGARYFPVTGTRELRAALGAAHDRLLRVR